MTTSSTILFLIILTVFSLISPSLSDPATPVSPSTACNSTVDPTFCQSILPPSGSQNLYSYGRFSITKSLSNANKFLALINKFLSRNSSLSPSAVSALLDCQLLSTLNIDFLNSASGSLSSNNTLLDPQAEKVQTLLSALLTNQQTCLDGLQGAASAWSVKNGLTVPISNSTKLYSVSLALFNKAWVPKTKKVKPKKGFTPSRVPTIPSGRRGLLESSDSVMVNDIVVVNKDGTGNFTTILAAVAATPDNLDGTTGYYLIYVYSGIYEEYVNIPKNKRYIMMIGDGINQTIITGNHSVVDGWTTFNSATFAVVGQGFVAVNMTFRNTAGPAKHQAVAVRNGADLSAFYSCSFEGYQDTLYTHSMRQFYRECDIYGTVDYIFGNAAVVFQDCNIYSRLPMSGQSNTITAQGRTDPNQNTGTSIHNCKILAAPDLASSPGSVISYLGRPWKAYSRTVIMQSFIDGLIDPTGWMPWDGNFALSTLYYAEYSNNGAGSNTTKRVSWPGFHVISATDVGNFTVTNFVLGDNWLPQTGVPYLSGLL
ncbi:hypothetical protein LUZ61_000084 [Rhynchospora tenuis]|uniref:Pectinesterase n=1 Tax=Rhynchospora tenuis TaxID=198213 RepID=A0AAD5ZE19_9POAL|nr:hypothetical protein LUZ61_020992 [Rhynchospora tenuis]KAJ3696379.1 hypothetical protein LUZ61_000084 [Rhynchospora tenuis]